MTDTNKNCNSCDYCQSCNYCNSCDYCYSCYSCYSCNYCNYCQSCDSCDSCHYCNSCDSCDSCDSCHYCNWLRMSERMIFCLGEGRHKSKGAGYQKNLQIFNTPVTEDVYSKTLSLLNAKNTKLPIATRIKVDDIKDPTTTQKQLWGYLKTLSYKDVRKEYRTTATQEDANFFKSLPHFDIDIFTKITGITQEDFDEKLWASEDVLIKNGKKYRVQIIGELEE